MHGARMCIGCSFYGVCGVIKNMIHILLRGQQKAVNWVSVRVWDKGRIKTCPGLTPSSGRRASTGSLDFPPPPSQLPAPAPSLHRSALNPRNSSKATEPFSLFPRGCSSCVPNSWWCYLRVGGSRRSAQPTLEFCLSLATQPSLPSTITHPQVLL